MGNKPLKKENEKISNLFTDLDNKKIIEKKLTHLNFYEKFEEEFPFLRHFILSDYMNNLNTFTMKPQNKTIDINPSKENKNIEKKAADEYEAINQNENETEENFSKDNWMEFFDKKILNNPLIERLNPSELEIKQQKQLWDDIFDDVKVCYNLVNNQECDEIPKSIFFAVGFIYCMNRKSQKIIILANLFTTKDNKITIDNNLYIFFFLIYYLILFTPIRFFEKEIDLNLPNNNYLYKIKNDNVQSIKKNFKALKICVANLVNELIDNIFILGNEVLTRDEFINKILDDDKNNFIFSNIAIKNKIEDRINEKGIITL
jgi:hypothetical protein